MGTGGSVHRACSEGSERRRRRSDYRDDREVSARQAGVLAAGQASHIWGAPEELSPRLFQLLRLPLNLRTVTRPASRNGEGFGGHRKLCS